MKTILYMAITANGLIARENGQTDFVSQNEWKNFSKAVKKSGNIVIRSRTFEVMQKEKEFSRLGKITVVVVSKKTKKTLLPNLFFVRSPKEALHLLKKMKFEIAMVAGGGALNASFLKQGLLDELFLDVMPSVLGFGIPLFRLGKSGVKLKLLEVKRLAKNEVQLHYKVVR